MQKKSMIATAYEKGQAEDVVVIEERALVSPEPKEVLVKMVISLVNPADINRLEGTYAKPLEPGTAPGLDGVGAVEEIGEDVENLKVGDRVIAPRVVGKWSTYLLIPEEECIVIPDEVTDLQAAHLSVNPPTAYWMLTRVASLKPGDWVLQNGSNSCVGRCVIELCHHLELKTQNIVRRQSLAAELEALGANMVVTEPIKMEGLKLGLNMVGGPIATQMAKALEPGSTLVTYGAMSKEPMVIPNGILIFRDIRFIGFFKSNLIDTMERNVLKAFFDEMLTLCKQGLFTPPIEKEYSLPDVKAALTHAQQPERSGKICLRF